MVHAKRKYGRRKTYKSSSRKSRYRNKASNSASRYVVPGYTRNKGFYGRYKSTASQELKFRDTTVTANAPATVGNLDASLHAIPQGVAENERVGRKIWIKDIEVRGSFELLTRFAGPNTGFARARLLIAIDKQCNGAVVGANEVLESNDIDSFYEQSNSGRFTILLDEVYLLNTRTLNNDAVPRFANNTRSFRFKKSLNLPVEFTGATGAITEIQSNNIFMQHIGDQGGGLIQLDLSIRTRYTD